jgi:hypothetical protein
MDDQPQDARVTLITQGAASRRFEQGLHFLLEKTNMARETLDDETFLAVLAVMSYLAAYVWRDENLFGVRKQMVALLEPWRHTTDIERIVSRATELAQVFRRPWSEPLSDPPTI